MQESDTGLFGGAVAAIDELPGIFTLGSENAPNIADSLAGRLISEGNDLVEALVVFFVAGLGEGGGGGLDGDGGVFGLRPTSVARDGHFNGISSCFNKPNLDSGLAIYLTT